MKETAKWDHTIYRKNKVTYQKGKNTLSDSFKQAGPYLGLGTQLAATMVVMLFLGKWVDSLLNSYPVATIAFGFLGSLLAIYNFIKTVIRLNDKKRTKDNN